MATPIKHRRVVAAGVLSLSLIAPSVAIPQAAELVLPAAAAQNADVFNGRYTTANFWNEKEAVVEGLTLEPGTKVEPTTNTIFNWNFRNDGGQLVLIRPQSQAAFKTGDVDIRVKVTPANGNAYRTTLKVTVVDEGRTPPAAVEEAVDKQSFDERYPTANFWNANEAAVEGLTLQPGTTVKPAANTIFNWNFRNDGGQLVLIRPQSQAAFRAGEVDIPVRVAEGNGSTYNTTLKVNVIDARTPKEWEQQLAKTYTMDFEKSAEPKAIEDITLPEGVTLSKGTVAPPPPGWGVSVEGGKVTVKPASTFTEGFIELPVTVNDGTDEFGAKLRINAKNPQTSTSDITSGVGKTIGSIVGGLLGIPNLGNLLGGGSGGSGGGSGRLVNVVITNNANNNGSPNIIITNNANPVITGNANDNGSNNGSHNSAVITNNANPVITGNANDNASNNGSNNSAVITNNANPVITGNANPNVEIKDNANPVITGNANPNVEIKDNANPSVVITNNANPVITGNANPNVEIKDNGSNNASNNTANVSDNANPTVVITGNANPVITGNANPNVEIKDNGSNNASNNTAEIKDNANPVVTGNANPTVGGGLGSALGGSSKRDKGNGNGDGNGAAGGGNAGSSNRGGSSIGADVEATGGLTDPRCVASLAGLGLPLLLAIPVALAQGLNTPGLDQLSAQVAGALNDTARNFGVEAAQVTAVAGGVVGATLAVVGALALATCIPDVQNVGITVGGPKTVTETSPTPAPAATVVTNPTEPTAAA
ncbi:hypothetical protein V6D40_09120 [Corynebacterium sp. Q4381]|uniref:hypothetical protein n=1 Tax=Corynebacterium sp. Marseille-Q4381 TaxID=3121597 RepID=UPI002FE64E5C